MADGPIQNVDVKSVVKKTAIGTAAVGAILLNVMVFRITGDIISSLVLFGLGYAAAKLK